MPRPASPPVRGRGLKRVRDGHGFLHHVVAPRAGAWVETRPSSASGSASTSLPVRGRGLKLHVVDPAVPRVRSPPVRGRGLKPAGSRRARPYDRVAPRAGAWVETA